MAGPHLVHGEIALEIAAFGTEQLDTRFDLPTLRLRPRRRDSETGSGARDPCGAPRNVGVQGGTESSNLLCSSKESRANLISGAMPRALLELAGDVGKFDIRTAGPGLR